MRLVESRITAGEYWLTLRSVEPFNNALRWEWVTEDGEQLTSFTTQRFGQTSNARLLAEVLLDRSLGRELDTDDLIGHRLHARIVPHPLGGWRLRIAEVRSESGDRQGRPLAKNGQDWFTPHSAS